MFWAAKDAQFQPASDRSLLVYVGQEISLDVHQRVIKLLRMLEREPIDGVSNMHPAYCSILIDFDMRKLTHGELESISRDRVNRLADETLPEPRKMEIPVCYEGDYAPDLNETCSALGVSKQGVIELHTSVEYIVYFLGFVPGFAYLGELPEALTMPRLSTPRRSVPPGSVGIAGNQTGVYPFATPGGWRLIGCTPFTMFHPAKEPASI